MPRFSWFGHQCRFDGPLPATCFIGPENGHLLSLVTLLSVFCSMCLVYQKVMAKKVDSMRFHGKRAASGAAQGRRQISDLRFFRLPAYWLQAPFPFSSHNIKMRQRFPGAPDFPQWPAAF
jgi:hypothetical protein